METALELDLVLDAVLLLLALEVFAELELVLLALDTTDDTELRADVRLEALLATEDLTLDFTELILEDFALLMAEDALEDVLDFTEDRNEEATEDCFEEETPLLTLEELPPVQILQPAVVVMHS